MYQKVFSIFLLVISYKVFASVIINKDAEVKADGVSAEKRVSVQEIPRQLYPLLKKTKSVIHQEENEVDDNGDYFAYPKYNYKYGVEDPHTGDKKLHYEERDGDVVKGQYKVVDPDGYIRIVDYTVDKDNGFQATVTRRLHQGPLYDHEKDNPY